MWKKGSGIFHAGSKAGGWEPRYWQCEPVYFTISLPANKHRETMMLRKEYKTVMNSSNLHTRILSLRARLEIAVEKIALSEQGLGWP